MVKLLLAVWLGLTRVPQEPVQEPPEGLSCVGLLVSWWSFFSLGAAGPPSASERFKSGSLHLSRRPLPRPTLGRARTDSGWRRRTHAGTSESGFNWGECLGVSSHRLIDEIRFRRGSGSATRRQHALTSGATSFTHKALICACVLTLS